MLKIDAYHRPARVEDALSLLREGRTVVAGGTDLLVNPRYMVGVREVIDLAELPLDYIEGSPGLVRVGARATMRDVSRSALVRALADGIVARAAAVCGSPNIRNAATMAGNVASALPSADTPPTLLALEASVLLRSAAGERELPLEEFFVGPAKSARHPDELLVEIRIPVPAQGTRGGFCKVGRVADDIAMTNAAAVLRVEDGVVAHARLVLGAVAPVPLRIEAAEGFLEGRPAGDAELAEAAELAAAASQPIDDQRASAGYRRRMAAVCARRALRQAAGLDPHGGELDHA
jgi:carbon-monoxide dehydrogenase medium subunit